MEAAVPYTFNIINCEKVNSQFNFGEQLTALLKSCSSVQCSDIH